MGFEGPVLLTNQAFRQIHYKPKNTMILDSTAPELELEPGFSFSWGRTGHCAGAVWYHISCEGKSLFFSGDYRENDPFYICDEVRDLSADVAVLDSAYETEKTGEEMRQEVLKKAEELRKTGAPVLFPVPHFGRGLSLAVRLYENMKNPPPLHMDLPLYDEWKRLGHRNYFAQKEARHIGYDCFLPWSGNRTEPGHFYFLTDAQLAKASTRELIEKNPDLRVLMTGSIHGYGRAAEYYKSGRAELVLWPNHMTEREMKELAEKNHFSKVIPFHNPYQKLEYTALTF